MKWKNLFNNYGVRKRKFNFKKKNLKISIGYIEYDYFNILVLKDIW